MRDGQRRSRAGRRGPAVGGTGNPNFALAVGNPSLTTNPNEPAVFNETLTASGGYNNTVSLRCAGAVPPTCTVSPATLTPTTAGAAFIVTSSSDVQNHFNFTIDGTGSDAGHIIKQRQSS